MNTSVLDKQTLQFGRLMHYAGIAIVLIAGAAAHSWLYMPIEAEMFNVEVRIDEMIQSKKNTPLIQSEHSRLSKRLREISARYASLQQRVPESAEAGRFLKEVSDIALDENMVVNDFQPANAVPGDGYSVLEVNLTGAGSFASICSFFDRLAKLERLAKVKNLVITTDGQSETYPMSATLIIYFGLQRNLEEVASREVARG